MEYPTIHLNGTSQDQLYNDLSSASNALLSAYNALQACFPNERDYYVKKDKSAFKQACKEHRKRMETITQIRQEIYDILEKVSDQWRY